MMSKREQGGIEADLIETKRDSPPIPSINDVLKLRGNRLMESKSKGVREQEIV